jgi:hypothetical protein
VPHGKTTPKINKETLLKNKKKEIEAKRQSFMVCVISLCECKAYGVEILRP